MNRKGGGGGGGEREWVSVDSYITGPDANIDFLSTLVYNNKA